MKHKIKISEYFSGWHKTNFYSKRIALILYFLGFVIFNINSQNTENKTVELDQKAFTFSVNYTSDSLMTLSLNNHLESEFSPFFIELYFNGYVLNVEKVEQNLNGIPVSDNTEYIRGPQFLGMGLHNLPPSCLYNITFKIKNKLVEKPTLKVRIYGELNGQQVIYLRGFNF